MITTIKWNKVDMNKRESIPAINSSIVFCDGSIYSGLVLVDSNNELYVQQIGGIGKKIKSGFLWCYTKDIKTTKD
jgi:hypothetical protein